METTQAPSVTRQNSNSDEGKINSIIDHLFTSLSKHDAEEAVSVYADENVMYTLAPPLENKPGSSPGIEGVEQWLATFREGPNYETKERSISIDGNLAFSYGLVRMTGKKKNGEVVDLWYRETDCLKKIDGEWKVVHQHESVPFYMDGSNHAAMDLKPESH